MQPGGGETARGEITHVEFPVTDVEAAKRFCGAVAGWEFLAMPEFPPAATRPAPVRCYPARPCPLLPGPTLPAATRPAPVDL